MSRNFSLNSDKINEYLVGDKYIYIYMITSSSFLLRMKNVSDKSCTETQNKRIIFNHFFFSENIVFMR